MEKKSLKYKFKRRKRILCVVLGTVIAAVAWYGYLVVVNKSMDIKQFAEEFVAIAISALISTFLAIWLTKNDIIEDDFSYKKDKFGIITVESGYRKFFQNTDSESYLNVSDFGEFFTKNNKERNIQIVGIALRGFFADENESLVDKLLHLCINEQYSVEIIIANPYSDEVKIQSKGRIRRIKSTFQKALAIHFQSFKKQLKIWI